MNQPISDQSLGRDFAYGRWAAGLILGVLIFRLVILCLNPLGLHGDEAQYWAWSRDLDFGYFSKPPLIAWVIAASTTVLGHEEWVIRLASPLLHSGTASLIFASARRLYDGRAGLLASLLYLFMPGVTLSSTLISTDALLLFCFSGALYAWVRVRETPTGGWAAGLGLAIGAGFLAKYAMIYIVPALVFALLFEPKTKAALLGRRGLLTGVTALIAFAPNIIWNAQNRFMTLSHTSDNANLDNGPQINPGELAEFLLGQLGVFGPISFVLLILALVAIGRQRRGKNAISFEHILALLVITPLLVISMQALISRANANWAVVAYASAPILMAGWVTTDRRRLWGHGAIAFNAAIALIAPLILIQPAWVDAIGATNSVKRLRAWPETKAAIEARFNAGDYEVIAVDNRLVFYDLLYYGMEATAPLYQWRFEPGLSNHAELTQGLPEGDPRSVLLLSQYDDYAAYFADDFETMTREADLVIDLGGGLERRLNVYRAVGYSKPRPRNHTPR